MLRYTSAPTVITGYGTTSGFEMHLEDKNRGNLDKFFVETQNFMGNLMKRPEIAIVQTSFNPSFLYSWSTWMLPNVSRLVSVRVRGSVYSSGYYGGMYVSTSTVLVNCIVVSRRIRKTA